jgi:nitric oxide reductase NorD protein
VRDPGTSGRAEAPAGSRFSLLASAVAARPLDVAFGPAGARAWTDGRRVLIDPAADRGTQLESVVVQASMIGAGSLSVELLAQLVRKPLAWRRYLSLEGHRSLSVLESLIPPSVAWVTDRQTAGRTASPHASLLLAIGSEAIPDPPDSFGEIRPRLVTEAREIRGEMPPRLSQRLPSSSQVILRDLEGGVEDAPPVDILASPVGGGGPIGRLLKRLIGDARSATSGPPGGDTPTRSALAGHRVSRLGSAITGRASLAERTFLGASLGHRYPEWDVHHGRYRPQWCTVVEAETHVARRSSLALPETQPLKRALARLGTDLERVHRQPQGDDIDVDAAVEAVVEMIAGSGSDGAIYIESQRHRRDLSVLIVLDISGSAGEPSPAGGTVHTHQRVAAAGLTAALYEIGDRVALYGFRSQGRSAVSVIPVKRFDEGLASLTQGRLSELVPGGFTRLGAAIRHGARTLEREGGTGRQLLVVLSDGLAYDHGYETAYGEADARRALSEARHRGIGCLCLSVGSSTDARALLRVFGTAAHAGLPTVDQLPRAVGPLFRAALLTAEFQRRRATQAARMADRLQIDRGSA